MSITNLYSDGRRLTAKEWAERREQSIEKIGERLAVQRLRVCDVVDAFGLNSSTAYAHLMYMEELGLAHRTGDRDHVHREFWAAGRGQRRTADLEELEEVDAITARTVPAVQVGMQRDALVEALFGPARRAA